MEPVIGSGDNPACADPEYCKIIDAVCCSPPALTVIDNNSKLSALGVGSMFVTCFQSWVL